MEDRTIDADALSPEDREFDVALRPRSLADFVGQDRVKEQLAVLLDGARKRGEQVDHLLFSGPPGLGKTTLAQIVALEMAAGFQPTSGPVLERPSDLAAILTNLGEGDVLFVDEIHRMPRAVEEVLYPALEDFTLDVVLGKGPTARSIRLDLPRFTLVGATTRPGRITLPLRERFGFSPRLDYYVVEDLTHIVLRSAGILGVKTDPEGAGEIARRSRGTPRIANRLLRRVRDVAEVRHEGAITGDIARAGLAVFEVDEEGLDRLDHAILSAVIQRFSGGPVGLSTLAAAVGEEPDTVEDVVEPYLLQLGF
ncbi:MAG: Holliday junction branch migration DNA helicase RuvB, partial [Actinomycetota bacterium]